MDSRAWVVASGLIAAALAALVIIDLAAPEPEPPAHRIVPEWSAAAVRAIRIERAGESLVLQRTAPGTPGEGWTLRLPDRAVPADPAAVRDLLGTVDMLAAIRRDPGPVEPALTLVIERDGGPPIRLLVADPSGATDRVWLARDGTSGRFLIDGYAARALAPAADALRERRPLRGRVDGATRIEAGAAILTGSWMVQLPGGAARADRDRVEQLLLWASRARIERFADQAQTAPPVRLLIDARAGRTEIVFHGACGPGMRLADTPLGRGCMPFDESLLAPPEAWVDRDLVGTPIDGVARLRLTEGSRAITVERADSPDALRAWLARWREAAAGPVVDIDGTPVATVELELDGGKQRLTILRAGTRLAARREGEPVALLLHPWAAAHLDPAPHRFRSLDLLPHEPTALRAAIARRGATIIESIERGDTLEEWRTRPSSVVIPAALESLREAAGFLAAVRFESARARPADGLSPPRRTVELVFDPAPGKDAPVRHTIEIGAATAGGCHARLDRDPAVFELGAERCAALLGPWTQAAAP